MTEKERPATRTGLERGSDFSIGSRRGSSDEKNSRSFVVRWRDVVCVHPELTSTGTLVLYTLSLWMSASGSARPSASTISNGCKFNRSTGRDIVGRELKEAVRLGLLAATTVEGRPTIYQAVIPACFRGVGRGSLNLPALNRDLPALEGVPAPREQARNSSEIETTNRKDLETSSNPSSMTDSGLVLRYDKSLGLVSEDTFDGYIAGKGDWWEGLVVRSQRDEDWYSTMTGFKEAARTFLSDLGVVYTSTPRVSALAT